MGAGCAVQYLIVTEDLTQQNSRRRQLENYRLAVIDKIDGLSRRKMNAEMGLQKLTKKDPKKFQTTIWRNKIT